MKEDGGEGKERGKAGKERMGGMKGKDERERRGEEAMNRTFV